MYDRLKMYEQLKKGTLTMHYCTSIIYNVGKISYLVFLFDNKTYLLTKNNMLCFIDIFRTGIRADIHGRKCTLKHFVLTIENTYVVATIWTSTTTFLKTIC